MENYIVSARKYRPGVFTSVVGQSHVTNTLKSAILMGQLAHAFLFSGPRGVGKTTCARILAKAINCENLTPEGEPCNTCDSCMAFNEGKSMTIHELDAASNNSVEDIRNLIEQTRYVPPTGKSGKPKRSVYIIDEVHMLSQAAFNAFLKTLEEPPAHVLFILATTEKHKILPTILSRCQKHDFRRIKVDDIARHLEYISKEENIEYEFAALQQVGLKAEGALRDALSLFDQLVSYGGGKLSFESVLENLNILDYDYFFRTVEAIQSQDHKALLLMLNEIIEKGFESKAYMVGLTEHFRNLLVCQSPETVDLLETSENVKEKYKAQSQAIDPSFLLNAFHLCSEAERNMKMATHPRLAAELALVKLAHLGTAIRVVAEEPEKKKSLAPEGKTKAVEGAEKPIEPAPVREPEPEKKTVETPVAIAEKKTAPIPVKIPETPAMGGLGLANLSNLNALKQAAKADLTHLNGNAEEDETPKTFALDPNVRISESQYQQALFDYISLLNAANSQVHLVSILSGCRSSLHHNKWEMKIENAVQKNILERDQEMLPFFRSVLKVPNLFLEIVIDETYVNPDDKKPYTEEQKLKEMEAKNPTLLDLQKTFKTRIIYR